MYNIRDINQSTIMEFQLKHSYKTGDSIFTKNDANEIYNTFLNKFLRHYHSCFPVIKTNILSYGRPWITSVIRTSCKYKRELYMECRNYKNPTLDRYYKDYCQI